MAKRNRSYVEEAFRQIQEQPEVLDVLALNAAGNPVKTTMEEENSLQYAGMYSQLFQKAKYAVKQLDPEDDVIFLRVRTKRHETLMTPDENLTFIVTQNAEDNI